MQNKQNNRQKKQRDKRDGDGSLTPLTGATKEDLIDLYPDNIQIQRGEKLYVTDKWVVNYAEKKGLSIVYTRVVKIDKKE